MSARWWSWGKKEEEVSPASLSLQEAPLRDTGGADLAGELGPRATGGHRPAQEADARPASPLSAPLHAQCQQLAAKNKQLVLQVEQYRRACGALQKESDELGAAMEKCVELEARNDGLEVQLSQLESLLRGHSLVNEAETEELRSRYTAVEQEKSGLELQIDQLNSVCRMLQVSGDDSKEQLLLLQQKCSALVGEKKEMSLRVDQLQALVNALKTDQAELEDHLEGEREGLTLQVDQLESRCRALEDDTAVEAMCDDYEAERDQLLLQVDQLQSTCSALQADGHQELRILRTRCTMLEAEKEELQLQVDQLRALCNYATNDSSEEQNWEHMEVKFGNLLEEKETLALQVEQLSAALRGKEAFAQELEVVARECERLHKQRGAELALQLDQVQASFRGLESESGEAKVLLQKAWERCKELEHERSSFLLHVEQLQAACKALETTHSTDVQQLSRQWQGERGVLQAQQGHLKLQADQLRTACQFLNDDKASEEARREELETELGKLQQRCGQLEDSQGSCKSCTYLTKRCAALEGEMSSLSLDLQRAQAQCDRLASESRSPLNLDAEFHKLTWELQRSQRQCDSLQEENARLRSQTSSNRELKLDNDNQQSTRELEVEDHPPLQTPVPGRSSGSGARGHTGAPDEQLQARFNSLQEENHSLRKELGDVLARCNSLEESTKELALHRDASLPAESSEDLARQLDQLQAESQQRCRVLEEEKTVLARQLDEFETSHQAELNTMSSQLVGLQAQCKAAGELQAGKDALEREVCELREHGQATRKSFEVEKTELGRVVEELRAQHLSKCAKLEAENAALARRAQLLESQHSAGDLEEAQRQIQQLEAEKRLLTRRAEELEQRCNLTGAPWTGKDALEREVRELREHGQTTRDAFEAEKEELGRMLEELRIQNLARCARLEEENAALARRARQLEGESHTPRWEEAQRQIQQLQAEKQLLTRRSEQLEERCRVAGGSQVGHDALQREVRELKEHGHATREAFEAEKAELGRMLEELRTQNLARCARLEEENARLARRAQQLEAQRPNSMWEEAQRQIQQLQAEKLELERRQRYGATGEPQDGHDALEREVRALKEHGQATREAFEAEKAELGRILEELRAQNLARCARLEEENAALARRAQQLEVQRPNTESEEAQKQIKQLQAERDAQTRRLEQLQLRCEALEGPSQEPGQARTREVSMVPSQFEHEVSRGENAALAKQVKDLQEQRQVLQNQLSQLQKEAGGLQSSRERCAALDREKAQLQVQLKDFEQHRDRCVALDAEKAQLQMQLKDFEQHRERCVALDAEKVEFQRQLEELEPHRERCVVLDRERAELQRQLQELEPHRERCLSLDRERGALDGKLQEVHEHKVELERQVEELLPKCQSLDAEKAALTKQVEELLPLRETCRALEGRQGDLARKVEELEPLLAICEALERERTQLVADLKSQHKLNEVLQDEKSVLEAEFSGMHVRNSTQMEALTSQRDDLARQIDHLQANRGGLLQLPQVAKDASMELELEQAKCSALEEERDELTRRVADLQASAEPSTQAQVSQLQAENTSLKETLQSLQTEASHELQQISTRYSNLQTKASEELQQLRAQCSRLESDNAAMQNSLDTETAKATEGVQELKARCLRLESDNASLQDSLDTEKAKAAQLDALQRMYSELMAEIAETSVQCQGATTKLSEQDKELAELRSKCNQLESSNQRLQDQNLELQQGVEDHQRQRDLELHSARGVCEELESVKAQLAAQSAADTRAREELEGHHKQQVKELQRQIRGLELELNRTISPSSAGGGTLGQTERDLEELRARHEMEMEGEGEGQVELEQLRAKCSGLVAENAMLLKQHAGVKEAAENDLRRKDFELEQWQTRFATMEEEASRQKQQFLQQLRDTSSSLERPDVARQAHRPDLHPREVEELSNRCRAAEVEVGRLSQEYMSLAETSSKVQAEKEVELDAWRNRCIRAEEDFAKLGESALQDTQAKEEVLELRARCSQLEVNLLEMEALYARIGALEAENERYGYEVGQLQQSVQDHETVRAQQDEAAVRAATTLAHLRSRCGTLEDVQRKCSSLQEERDNLNLQVERLARDYSSLEQDHSQLTSHAERALQAQEALQEKHTRLSEEVQQHHSRAAHQLQERRAAAAELTKLRSLLAGDPEPLPHDLSAADEDWSGLAELLDQVRNEIVRHRTARQAAEREVRVHQEQVDRYAKEGDALREKQGRLQAEHTALGVRATQLVAEVERHRGESNNMEVARKRAAVHSEVLQRQAEQQATERGALEAETFRLRAENSALSAENARLRTEVQDSQRQQGEQRPASLPPAPAEGSQALTAAERWVLYQAAAPLDMTPGRTYLGCIKVDFRELQALPQPPLPTVRVKLSAALESGALARAALQAFRNHDHELKGFLDCQFELPNFVEALFRQHNLAPPQQAQTLELMQRFDQMGELRLDARSCLCLVDALVRGGLLGQRAEQATVHRGISSLRGESAESVTGSERAGVSGSAVIGGRPKAPFEGLDSFGDKSLPADDWWERRVALERRLQEAELAAERATARAAGAAAFPNPELYLGNGQASEPVVPPFNSRQTTEEAERLQQFNPPPYPTISTSAQVVGIPRLLYLHN